MEALKFISEQMKILGINYEFGEWTSKPVPKTYCVGELPSPEGITTEDGKIETTLFLNIFTWGKYLELEEIRDKIKKHFNMINGLRAKTGSGSIAVFYDGGFFVPTNEADLKKLQINLRIIEWKGVSYI